MASLVVSVLDRVSLRARHARQSAVSSVVGCVHMPCSQREWAIVWEWPRRAGRCVRSGLPLRSVKVQKQCAKSNIPNSTRLLSTVSVSVIVYMLPHTTRHTYKRIYDRTGYPAHPDIHSKVIVKIRFRVSQRRPAFGLIPEVPSEVYAI